MIAVAVGHAFDDFDFVVDAFQKAGVKGELTVGHDAIELALHEMSEPAQGLNAAGHGAVMPVRPKAQRGRIAVVLPELF